MFRWLFWLLVLTLLGLGLDAGAAQVATPLGRAPATATAPEPAPDLGASLLAAANTPQTPFTGRRTTTWTITEPGTYVFPRGTVIAIPPSQAKKKNAVDIKSSYVTIRGLTITSGFRGFSCQSRSNISIEDCTV